MQTKLLATEEMAARYLEVFVNRRAYTMQSPKPHEESGKHYYYRPKGAVALSTATIRRHLEGEITIGLYAINPQTQRCKWVAIDADYSTLWMTYSSSSGNCGRTDSKQHWKNPDAEVTCGSSRASRYWLAIAVSTFTTWRSA